MKIEELTPQILAEHNNYIKAIVHKTMRIYPKNPRWDADDIEGIVLWAFVESWCSYDPIKYKDVPFKAYAKRHILNRIKKFVAVNIFTLKANYENLRRDKPDEITRLHDLEVGAVREYALDGEETFESYCKDNRGQHEEIVEKKEIKALIRELINSLSGYERRLYRLRFIEDNTLKEIGEKTGDSVSNVMVNLNKLMAKLKERIEYRQWQQLL